jgi:hypothetical protein
MEEQLTLDLGLEKSNSINSEKTQQKDMHTDERRLKSTQAVATTFGWFFQVVAAIVLSLKYRTKLKSVKVEGQREDIELYFQNDKKPIYIQAKASSKKIDQVTKSDLVKRCSDAMNTLVNTSNIVKNDYSGLMYISNFLNPLNLDDRIADAYWNPKATELLQKNFDDLPKQGQQFLLDCETKAKYELKKKNYTYSDNYFDWNRLTVASLPLYREKDPYNPEQFNTESRVLITFIEEILTAISESQTYTDNIYHVLISKYFGNSTKTKITITINEILWIFISQVISKRRDAYISDFVPLNYQYEVEKYSNQSIADMSMNIEVINKILSYWESSECRHQPYSTNVLIKFLDQTWPKFKDIVPLPNEELQKYCINDLITRVLMNQHVINNLKGEFKA